MSLCHSVTTGRLQKLPFSFERKLPMFAGLFRNRDCKFERHIVTREIPKVRRLISSTQNGGGEGGGGEKVPQKQVFSPNIKKEQDFRSR